MAETWLPAEPPPSPKLPSRARRTLLLWIVLVAVFAVFYGFASSTQATHGDATTHASSAGTWSWLVVAAPIAVVVGTFLWALSGSRRFNAQQKPGLDAMSVGQYARAAQLFGAVARRYRTKPNFAAIATCNQGFALIRAGDAATAVGSLLSVERSPLPQLAGLRGSIAVELACAFAIGGDIDKAERWLDAARSRNASDPLGSQEASIAAAEGMIHCRAGRFERALRHYDDCWQRLESKLIVRTMHGVWLLRAFAVSKLSTPRDAAAAEPWLRLLRGSAPGSFAWLTKHWPELEAFVDHELGPASPHVADRAEASTASPTSPPTPAA